MYAVTVSASAKRRIVNLKEVLKICLAPVECFVGLPGVRFPVLCRCERAVNYRSRCDIWAKDGMALTYDVLQARKRQWHRGYLYDERGWYSSWSPPERVALRFESA